MTNSDIDDRTRELLADEATKPARWFLLSFAKPGAFLGVTIVRARGMISAIRRTHALGINPGGEVLAYTFDKVSMPPFAIFEKLVVDKDAAHAILGT